MPPHNHLATDVHVFAPHSTLALFVKHTLINALQTRVLMGVSAQQQLTHSHVSVPQDTLAQLVLHSIHARIITVKMELRHRLVITHAYVSVLHAILVHLVRHSQMPVRTVHA